MEALQEIGEFHAAALRIISWYFVTPQPTDEVVEIHGG
jgi:hypothetical protein